MDLSAVFDELPVACALISPDLVFMSVNRAYERLARRPRDELVGRNIFQRCPAMPPAPTPVPAHARNHGAAW
ncbi:PAS domain-containing protein [Actinomadura violacea]|uniref:PAS domain-containing protein n=1 Tax=Actinomadura violacea TaxID=2819934 RepID=A0ABS3S576_9ACTN|nr:PAS domain-containing protein [Actinomadura violacea]MBO2464117.1 PAS domain-containing protein [Actinomadura violacea]